MSDSGVTRRERPIILIRGFGGLGVEDEKRVAYQGFNDGTVYPQKRGENYIYEGLILRFVKSRDWQYADATNVVGYYGAAPQRAPDIPRSMPDGVRDLAAKGYFSGEKVVLDPTMVARLLREDGPDLNKMLWVFRYYDLNERRFPVYGAMLARLIEFIRDVAVLRYPDKPPPKVNIIAHSMGGLIARETIQRTYPKGVAPQRINKVVTLGTPHKGISFQVFKNWLPIDAQDDLEHFNPDRQKDNDFPAGFNHFAEAFPRERLLTVVGTNYRTYGPVVASWLNRIFSADGEFGANYNRSDGLVKQSNAELPGAPRTFVHKCHGGLDSLVTSREAFEIATRFFFGNLRVRLQLLASKVSRGFDRIGTSEFFFGISIKPRGVDFDLFHQSAEAENCYGPFEGPSFDNPHPAFGWARDVNGLIWEGWLDTRHVSGENPDIVIRLDVYVGERDYFGLGFSDNVVFRKQYYVRGMFDDITRLSTFRGVELHAEERLDKPLPVRQINEVVYELPIGDDGFSATLRLDFTVVPEDGDTPDAV